MRPVFAYCFFVIGRTERDREAVRETEKKTASRRGRQTERRADRQRGRQTSVRSIIIGIGETKLKVATETAMRCCRTSARQSQNEATTHTHTRILALLHTRTHTSIQLKRKHNKKWRAYKIFRAFLFRIKIRTHTHKHTHAHSLCSAWLRSRACLGALFAANSPARCALSLAVSRSFEIRIKYWVRMSFVADCNVTKKVTTATNTHSEQHTHARLLL